MKPFKICTALNPGGKLRILRKGVNGKFTTCHDKTSHLYGDKDTYLSISRYIDSGYTVSVVVLPMEVLQ